MREMGVRVFAMTNPEGKIGQAVGAENCVMMASDHGAGGCEKGYYLADCFGLRLLNRRGCFPKFDLFIEQTKDVWKDMLDIRKRFEPRAEELARKYALADYTMFIGSGALWGETILYSMCLLEEMQWKRIRHITSARLLPRHARAASSPASRCSCSWARTSAAPSTSASAPSSPAA